MWLTLLKIFNPEKDILFFKDIIIGPIILLIIFVFSIWYRDRKYKNSLIKKYFIPGLFVRVLGSILTAIMYQYYYGGGDTTMYFQTVSQTYKMFLMDPMNGLIMLTRDYPDYTPEIQSYLKETVLNDRNVGFYSESTGYVSKIGSVVSLLTFNSYIAISFIFSFLAFIGCWKIFKTFYELYPRYHLVIAISTLFIPSVFFWGTGLMKDPLCLFGLGLLTNSFYNIFVKRKNVILSLILLCFASILIALIKVYILIAFLPAALVWSFLVLRKQIQNKLLRTLSGPLLISISIILGLVAIKNIGSVFEGYSPEEILQTAVVTQNYIKRVSKRKGGTAYDLGDMEPTIESAVSFFPKGVNVTLFRPYFWEIKKAINIPAASEALFTLFLTIYIIFYSGPLRVIKIYFNNPEVFFCLTFSILFAFAIGVSTYNFGSLSRYKIPCMPFYFLGLYLIYKESKSYIYK